MPYEIQPYTHLMAYKYGVKVIPSKNPNKKVDVLDFNGIIFVALEILSIRIRIILLFLKNLFITSPEFLAFKRLRTLVCA